MAADATQNTLCHIRQGGDRLELASGGSIVADSGSSVTLNGVFDNNATTTVNVGTAGTGVTASEGGNGILHQTTLTLSAVSVAVGDASVGGGTLIYTFPAGQVTILGGTASLTPTTTSTIATTLNASKDLSTGVGSVQTTTQASGTLATTEQNIINQFKTVSSATINVAGTKGTGVNGAAAFLDGTATAAKAFLNIGVPTATDIDGDATVTVSGTVTINWLFATDV